MIGFAVQEYKLTCNYIMNVDSTDDLIRLAAIKSRSLSLCHTAE